MILMTITVAKIVRVFSVVKGPQPRSILETVRHQLGTLFLYKWATSIIIKYALSLYKKIDVVDSTTSIFLVGRT